MNRNDGARGDARKRAADVPEYPDVLADDVPVPVDWWWTKEGRAQHIADAKADAWGEGWTAGRHWGAGAETGLDTNPYDDTEATR